MDLLKLRNEMKRKKPGFIRQQTGLMKQFRGSWRKPKGIHSKMRVSKRGHRVGPAVGYSSPKSVRGLTRDGLKLVLVKNLNELKNFKEGIVVVGSNTGLKKKIILFEEIVKRNINVSGVKDIAKHLGLLKERFSELKKERKNRKAKREKAREEKKEKKEEKKEKEDLAKKGKVEEKEVRDVAVKEKNIPIKKITAPKSQ